MFGQIIDPGDCLIGMTTSLSIPLSSLTGTAHEKKMMKSTRRCASIIYTGERAFCCEFRSCNNKQGLQVRKVVLLVVRVSIPGDKFSSRHGQKGILAYIVPDENMPWNPITGMILDGIVAPISMGSRMTMGHTKEPRRAKAVALAGSDMADPLATAFVDQTDALEEAGDFLVASGYQRNGCEILCDGMTGEQIETPIYVGPTFYQKVKQQVAEKIHARGTGPRSCGHTSTCGWKSK